MKMLRQRLRAELEAIPVNGKYTDPKRSRREKTLDILAKYYAVLGDENSQGDRA